MNSVLEKAIVLHRRPYRETSLLIELLTQNHGRIALVAKGARKSKSLAGLLQPFQTLLVSWLGKGELFTLTHAESLDWKAKLQGTQLYCALYLNELLLRCLQKNHPQPDLFELYLRTLDDLSCCSEAMVLRKFEWNFMEILGYGIDVLHDFQGEEIDAESCYYYEQHAGFVKTESSHHLSILGLDLLNFEQGDWDVIATQNLARKILQPAMQHLIGDKPFASRILYQSLKNQKIQRTQRSELNKRESHDDNHT